MTIGRDGARVNEVRFGGDHWPEASWPRELGARPYIFGPAKLMAHVRENVGQVKPRYIREVMAGAVQMRQEPDRGQAHHRQDGRFVQKPSAAHAARGSRMHRPGRA